MGFWTTLLSSAAFSAAICGLVMWHLREWISTRLKNSIQHEYEVKLEGYKAGYQRFLAENEIRFSRWHEEKLKAIKEVYSDLALAVYNLTFLLTLENDPRWQADQDLKSQVRKTVADRYFSSLEPRFQKWLYHRLFIGDEEDKIIAAFTVKMSDVMNLYNYCMTTNDVDILKKEGPKVINELDIIMNTLRHQFQDILQGKDAEQTASRK